MNNEEPEKKPEGRKISKKLRLKQRRFIAKFADPKSPTFGNGSKSAIAAGYSPQSSRQMAHENLTKPHIQREIESILDRVGATREKCAKVIREAMGAKVTRVFCPGEGELVYSKPLVDHQTRLKAVEMNHRLRGDFPSQEALERAQLLAIQLNVRIAPAVEKVPMKPGRDVEE